jgi:hypothetical protein
MLLWRSPVELPPIVRGRERPGVVPTAKMKVLQTTPLPTTNVTAGVVGPKADSPCGRDLDRRPDTPDARPDHTGRTGQSRRGLQAPPKWL